MAALFSKSIPSKKWTTFLLAGISLSIGWGIRGNFGHEYGAGFAGCLAAIAVAILSAREDWRKKTPYFALFGAIGWGFGASMSYMQVIAYTESGHTLTQWYGFTCLFIIGFLWAAIGGIGTALPAVMKKDQIVQLFIPLLFVFGARIILGIIEDPIARMLEAGIPFDDTATRHKNPLYWFDAYYLPAFSALAGIGVYDLWQRRGELNRKWLPVYMIAGAAAGWTVQFLMKKIGIDQRFANAITYVQGDPTYINPQTGLPAYDAHNLLNNWPQWFGDYPQHIGWLIGCIAGATVYFIKYGKFRNGASLIVYMAAGWLVAFLALPVLGSNLFAQWGGIRMTPPRSDDWSGVLGLFIGAMIWLWKNNLRAVACAAVICGIIGGLGFSGVQWIKTLLMSFGNENILIWKGILPGSTEYVSTTSSWSKWQAQNWHSFLEQAYGFINGIAVAAALAFLATRIKVEENISYVGNWIQSGRWTKVVATLSIVLGLTYFNAVKDVDDWSDQLDKKIWKQEIVSADGSTTTIPAQWDLPYLGRLPGMDFLHLSPEAWFTLTWILLIIACCFIVRRHLRSPIPVIPVSNLGKGQLILLLLLWIMNIANFMKALTGWHPQRMLTEWVIFVNVIITTALILILPQEKEYIQVFEEYNYSRLLRKYSTTLMVLLISMALFFTFTHRWVYHYPGFEQVVKTKKNVHTRFGVEADWRSKPNLKNESHK
ncbi:MAG: hypothetical protein QM802_15225 [Agriterribacter sp.]